MRTLIPQEEGMTELHAMLCQWIYPLTRSPLVWG